ncbi:hypothetical protein [Actinokineospora xionganensis]|uniref:MucR family transcriptional regulator n=1 Tax=Actinokineospora xionganensis TaxID=2684470 RepID=A0ABR7L311_9PSEU|nr:hypothetical protein [Actinokineospora xionganensis]MBC6447073.1 hypothetical protein [Actinokineospora xionganensis]
MIDPSEADPRAVYLRRRALAVAGAVLGVILLVWLIGALIGSDEDQQQVQGAAAEIPASAPPSTAPSAPESSTSAAPTTSVAAAPPAPTEPPPPPPDPNQPCPDATTIVTAELGAPSYQVGQRPKLSLVVVNSGPAPCTRDLGHELRELLITTPDGANRIWSSNDCYSPKGAEPTILQPGERKQYDVSWAGRTSAPGCPSKRSSVAAGTYAVTPKLGALTGPVVPLVLTPR